MHPNVKPAITQICGLVNEMNFLRHKIGGGGGNRTRVQNPSNQSELRQSTALLQYLYSSQSAIERTLTKTG
jgi:hypothetical protein